ncbi:unnamed protein product [Ambrosiozyma monospora]|uniref:Unnamed protein product n=1 Tax=Ambrosiozyma monospora TaxID=43982 RepID=A0ACB5SRH4_AMBMO|nr:unnamed protein product [Ambrosiozyma monospora]
MKSENCFQFDSKATKTSNKKNNIGNIQEIEDSELFKSKTGCYSKLALPNGCFVRNCKGMNPYNYNFDNTHFNRLVQPTRHIKGLEIDTIQAFIDQCLEIGQRREQTPWGGKALSDLIWNWINQQQRCQIDDTIDAIGKSESKHNKLWASNIDGCILYRLNYLTYFPNIGIGTTLTKQLWTE